MHLVAFPKLTQAYEARRVHTPNLRTVVRHVSVCGLALLQEHEDALVALATRAGPAEVAVFCQALAEVHRPEGEEAKVRAAGSRSVRISAVGDLAHLDAMLDPALATRLKATLAATAKCQSQPRRRPYPWRAYRGRARTGSAARHGEHPPAPRRAPGGRGPR